MKLLGCSVSATLQALAERSRQSLPPCRHARVLSVLGAMRQAQLPFQQAKSDHTHALQACPMWS